MSLVYISTLILEVEHQIGVDKCVDILNERGLSTGCDQYNWQWPKNSLNEVSAKSFPVSRQRELGVVKCRATAKVLIFDFSAQRAAACS